MGAGRVGGPPMDDLSDLLDLNRVLVAGVGGGGDVVGCVPTAGLLEAHGVDPVLAGLTWERAPHDLHAGPWGVDELDGVRPLAPHVVRATPEAGAGDGVRFAEARAAEHLPWPVLLLDPTDGPGALGEGLTEAGRVLGIDAVVALDAGGDVIARGTEEGVRSPLADAVSLAAIDRTPWPRTVGVLGWGSDGELSRESLRDAYADVARGGILGAWGITPATARRMNPLLETVPTEASRLPAEAARGQVGARTIRDGARSVDVGPEAAVTFYFRWEAVLARSETVPLVRGTTSIEAADEALREAGFPTEFSSEREWLRDRDQA